jgi:hypothetical protein
MTSQVKCPRIGPTCQPTRNRKSSAYAGLLVAGVLALATSPTVGATNDLESTLPGLLAGTTCTPQEVNTKLTEWDISNVNDIASGAVVVDDRSSSRQSKLWFVTRNGDTRVYRLTPGRNIKKDQARATSWPLDALGGTGGVRLRPSDDGRFVFINTNQGDPAVGGLVAVDTTANKRITWFDRPEFPHMSDVSVDTRGGYSVFTAAPQYFQDNFRVNTDGVDGVVQRLRPLQPKQDSSGNWLVPADVTRWPVGGGAGTCVDNVGGGGIPCIPGVVVDRRHGHFIYVSEPNYEFRSKTTGALISVGAIGEIDTRSVKCPTNAYKTCAKVRHWPIPTGTTSPRQILLDDTGRLWGIMSSGHLFALDIDRRYDKATLSRHDPRAPLGAGEDLFAVAPDGGTIGFTDSNEFSNKVAVLFPQRDAKVVYPDIRHVEPITRRLDGPREDAPAFPDHMITPRFVTAMGDMYTNPGDGTYVETNVATGFNTGTGSEVTSLSPTGMSPDGARKTGSFFYGVTQGEPGSNRVGHFEVPVDPNKETEHRKDDDDFDDDGDDDKDDFDDDNDGRNDDFDDDDDNDCTPDHMDKDWDNDGVENEHDSKSHRENKRTDRGTMAPGGAKEYEMEYGANSMAMLAIVEAADLTTPLSIEFVDPNGVVVLSTPPALGKAVALSTPLLRGVFTVRVKNNGLRSTTYKTTLVGKDIWF